MGRVIDFHSHILPCMDDGSKSLEMSLAMLRAESEQGIDTVVLTPHFYANHDTPERFLQRRAESVSKLSEAMNSQSGLPSVIIGAEVHFFEGISDCEFLSELAIDKTLGKRKCVMVEMPMRKWSDRILFELDGIRQKQNLTPIIAHVDRYIDALGKDIINKLSELPVLIQANASFFTTRSTRNYALKLLRGGAIHLLGSDCHGIDDRVPNLGEAVRVIEKHLGEDAIAYVNRWENGELRRP